MPNKGSVRVLCGMLAATLCLWTLSGCVNRREESNYAYHNLEAQEVAHQPQTPAAETADDPGEAVIRYLDSLRDWDGSVPVALPGDLDSGLAQTLSGCVVAYAARIDYRVGNARITGNRAVVDVSISAPELTGPLQELAVQAAGRMALEQVLGLELPTPSAMEQVRSLLEEDSLLKITRNTAAYLTMGGDGLWKLDLNAPENLDLVNCLTAGLVESVGSLFSSSPAR